MIPIKLCATESADDTYSRTLMLLTESFVQLHIQKITPTDDTVPYVRRYVLFISTILLLLPLLKVKFQCHPPRLPVALS